MQDSVLGLGALTELMPVLGHSVVKYRKEQCREEMKPVAPNVSIC